MEAYETEKWNSMVNCFDVFSSSGEMKQNRQISTSCSVRPYPHGCFSQFHPVDDMGRRDDLLLVDLVVGSANENQRKTRDENKI